ncbi:glycosyltransferase family 9 protein, partial [Thermosulfurimonas sp.]|uniref:glycosyltransferase family 9 protein n=1 Tax=Thermosulfurimonas sp. TaxID=2080236 RepID=UPI0025FE4441
MFYVLLSLLLYPFLFPFLRPRKNLSRLAVIQTAKIGDLICSTPVFREIKKRYPEVELTVLASPVARGVLTHNPYVDRVVILDKARYRGLRGKLRLARFFRREGFDAVISLNPNVLYAVSLFWGLVPLRIGILSSFSGRTYRLASLLFSRVYYHSPERMVSEVHLRMLEPLGIKATDPSRDIFPSPEGEEKARAFLSSVCEPLIGLAVSCRNRLKAMEPATWARLIDLISQNLKARVVLIGSEAERSFGDRILSLIRDKNAVLNALGAFTLEELPSLLKRLRIFVGVDTGIMYMADALGVPVVVIAGPTHPREPVSYTHL